MHVIGLKTEQEIRYEYSHGPKNEPVTISHYHHHLKKQTNRNTWLGPSGWLPLNCDTSILAFGKVSGRNGHSEGNLKYWDSMFNKYPQ